ncbi:hypothetical protein DET54_1213 [Paenibacillus pabuli]|uniref:Uncharacterized protein n=1 Tax=Paenibacillus pabuli TaxID=1472 RepID=A0ABX9BC89_9BACL|nr:hypothetical protein [Paenibacillus pabuli]RAI85648.1 hypothetical protein DET54_1213 [Paenibacillus pabuli]
MGLKIEYAGYIITELNYRVVHDDLDETSPIEEEIEQKSQVKLAIHRDLEKCVLNYEIDLETLVGGILIRTLEMTVQFQFAISNLEDGVRSENNEVLLESIKNSFSSESMHGLIKMQVRDIIKQFTSIDYFLPINNTEDIIFEIN